MTKGIAAITGGSGMVGRRIKQKLLQKGYDVRILTRNLLFRDDHVQVYHGDIDDIDALKRFLKNVNYLFHCAAELQNESKMWNINVSCTEMMLKIIPQSVTYFCYLSSAGVIGLTDESLVDEQSQCNPQNQYEKSKLAAEKLVAASVGTRSTVILRPTDVIDEQRPGAVALPLRGSLLDKLVVFLKGNERAHIVHAEDVAEAAVYFINNNFEKPSCFFVSCDHEPFNTFGGLWELYESVQEGLPAARISRKIYLPIIIPYVLRRLGRGPCNLGNVRYSSSRLLSTGFRYRLGVEGAVRAIASAQQFYD